MLSYRHAFHAGNHADVLKHLVLVQLLKYLNQKDKPYWVIDTHAGAGTYKLDEGYATQNAEFESGITHLWDAPDLPPLLAEYLNLVKEMNPRGGLRRYPGSPWFALRLARENDRVLMFELHSTDVKLLAENLNRSFPGQERRYGFQVDDGFLGLKNLLPPQPRRGLTLIDPSYEDKRDYLRVVMTIKEALTRFPGGTYAVWYPLLPLGDARQLPEKLKKLHAPSWLNVTLSVCGPSKSGYGMTGSGMFIVNPPWTLAEELREVMPYLAKALGQDDQATFNIEYEERKPENASAVGKANARKASTDAPSRDTAPRNPSQPRRNDEKRPRPATADESARPARTGARPLKTAPPTAPKRLPRTPRPPRSRS